MEDTIYDEYRDVLIDLEEAKKISWEELNARCIKVNAEKLYNIILNLETKFESLRYYHNVNQIKYEEEKIRASEKIEVLEQFMQTEESEKAEIDRDIINGINDLKTLFYNKHGMKEENVENIENAIKSGEEYYDELKELSSELNEYTKMVLKTNYFLNSLMWFVVGFLFTTGGVVIISYYYFKSIRIGIINKENQYENETEELKQLLRNSEAYRIGAPLTDDERILHDEEVEEALAHEHQEEQILENHLEAMALTSIIPERIIILTGISFMTTAFFLAYKLVKKN